MPGRVYAIASGKGGVGKSTTVVNLGVMIRSGGHTVAVVDGDLGMPNLATLLGVDAPVTLHDVLAGEAAVDEAIVEAGDGFSVIGGSDDLDEFAAADPGELGSVISALVETHDFVLVDTSAGLSYEGVLPLGIVDGIVLVTTPEETAVSDTAKTAEFAETIDGRVEGVVVTRADDATDAEGIASDLNTELLAVIPEDDAVGSSTGAGEPLLAHAPDSPAAIAYRGLAGRLAGDDIPESAEEPLGGDASDGDGGSDGEEDQEDEAREEEERDSGSGGFFSRLFGVFR